MALDFSAGRHDPKIGALATCFNIGDTAATIIEVTAEIRRQRDWLKFGVLLLPKLADYGDEIAGGGRGYIKIPATVSLKPEKMRQRKASPHDPSPEPDVFCVGKIVYCDKLGTVRETGFCRILDALRECWLPVADSEHEYDY